MANDGASKFDEGKLRYDLLPADALNEVARAFTVGAQKYDARNWEKGMSWGRMFGAAMRHLWAFWRGEPIDQETGVHHLALGATCVLMLLAYTMRKIGDDDRE